MGFFERLYSVIRSFFNANDQDSDVIIGDKRGRPHFEDDVIVEVPPHKRLRADLSSIPVYPHLTSSKMSSNITASTETSEECLLETAISTLARETEKSPRRKVEIKENIAVFDLTDDDFTGTQHSNGAFATADSTNRGLRGVYEFNELPRTVRTQQLVIDLDGDFETTPENGLTRVNCSRRNLLGEDLLTLKNLNWLNDAVINFYLELIVERSKNKRYPQVYAFSTFFLSSLENGYDRVRRYTKNVDIFSKDMILVPIHQSCHWCMAKIDLKSKEIVYFDSMLGSNAPVLGMLMNYLVSEHRDKKKGDFDCRGWTSRHDVDIPTQRNGKKVAKQLEHGETLDLLWKLYNSVIIDHTLQNGTAVHNPLYRYLITWYSIRLILHPTVWYLGTSSVRFKMKKIILARWNADQAALKANPQSEETTNAVSNQSYHEEPEKPKVPIPRCPICIAEMKIPEERMATPCGHVFCAHCLFQSFEYSRRCPTCRLPVDVAPRIHEASIVQGIGDEYGEEGRLYILTQLIEEAGGVLEENTPVDGCGGTSSGEDADDSDGEWEDIVDSE
ncbi:hypothetical protein GE061_005908 [Apolygus lucorum]|uniref:Ubiquitin-like protease family profile domain-containing protein n=1 Tax=Apolygus lucorum TaxID=248454 RepID=A0A8S9WRQ1_APOLU|nr:hypothetical protein GE061_005908 [Apolygus lucorum]